MAPEARDFHRRSRSSRAGYTIRRFRRRSGHTARRRRSKEDQRPRSCRKELSRTPRRCRKLGKSRPDRVRPGPFQQPPPRLRGIAIFALFQLCPQMAITPGATGIPLQRFLQGRPGLAPKLRIQGGFGNGQLTFPVVGVLPCKFLNHFQGFELVPRSFQSHIGLDERWMWVSRPRPFQDLRGLVGPSVRPMQGDQTRYGGRVGGTRLTADMANFMAVARSSSFSASSLAMTSRVARCLSPRVIIARWRLRASVRVASASRQRPSRV